MTYLSEIGQLWAKNQFSVTQKASFMTSNFKISSNFKRFMSHFSAFSYGNGHQSC